MFNNKSILITGGTGSFGKEISEYFLKNYNLKKLVIFSRDEVKQSEMLKLKFVEKNLKKIRFFIGDIRDKDRLFFALENIDYVLHAAALKQVPSSEYNPFETIKTNIIGAQNLIENCIKRKIKKIIALSTDKAAAPINLYGASKLCSDKLFLSANNYIGKLDIKFSVARYGNVFGSRGSVIPLFLKLLKQKKKLSITDIRMTRFHITLDEAVKFVVKSFKIMEGGELLVPKLPSIKILDIAKALNQQGKFKVIGLRPGEKIHEQMITVDDALNSYEFSDYYAIALNNEFKKFNFIKNKKNSIGQKAKKCPDNFYYASNNNKKFLNINQIKKIIKNYSEIN